MLQPAADPDERRASGTHSLVTFAACFQAAEVFEFISHSWRRPLPFTHQRSFAFFAKNETGFRFTLTSVSCYLVALNIVSLGYFVRIDAPSLHPIDMAADAESP